MDSANPAAWLTHFIPVLRFIQKSVICFAEQTNNWFLHETQHWAEMV